MAKNMTVTNVWYKPKTPGYSLPGSMYNCCDQMRTGALKDIDMDPGIQIYLYV